MLFPPSILFKPFSHQRFSCIIGPNGSGKSNVIDSMLFVFGYRAQKIRSKKLSVLIHSSDAHPDVQSCTVEVHFQKIIDKEGDDYDVIPNSSFYVSRTAAKDNSSSYHINGRKATFKDVGTLLRSHGIDLDHNRFLILQGEVEQIAMMKPKGQTEHDEGMLEYLEDIIGSCRLKEPINILCRRVELLNEQRGEKFSTFCVNCTSHYILLIFKKRNLLCQFYVHDLQKRVSAKEAEKQQIQEDTKELSDKSSQLTEEMKTKNEELKGVEKKLTKLTKFIESQKEKFTQLDLQDVEVREKLKHTKSKTKKQQKQLQKDKEKLEEVRSVPASSEKIITEVSAQKEELEKKKLVEEQKLAQVMESLKEETSGLQEDKEKKEQQLLELSKTVNETRSRMDVAQSELDIYLSQHNTAVSQLNQAKDALQEAVDTLRERRAAIKHLNLRIPQCEEQLKKLHGKTQNIGVATFIGLDKMKVWQQSMGSISTPENIPRLFDMVRVKDESVRPAFYFALRDTLVARDLEQATRVAFQKDKRWRVVTLQGQIIEQAGTMTGGGGRVMKGRMGSSLCADVTQEQLDKMESELNKELTQLQDWQQRKHQLEEKVHNARRELRDMKNTLEKYTATIQSLTEQELHLKTQIKDLEANVISAAPDKAKQKQMEKSLEVYRKDFEAASTKAGKVEAEVKRLHTLIVDINSHKLKAQQDKLDQINTQLDECSSAITKAQVAIKTAGRNLKKSEDSVSQLEKEMGENEKLMEELTEQLKKLEEAAGEIMQTYQQAEEALPEVQEQHRGVLQQIKALQEQEHALQKESLSVRLKVEHIDTAIAECHNKIKHWEREASRLSLHPIDGAPEEELPALNPEQLEDIGNPDVIKNEIALLEDRCSNMKPNLGAIAEFKKKEELYLQRVAELDDITTQRDAFKRGCEDLRKQRLHEFMAGFNIITNKLKENYQMLTLGGDAELELVDSLDPFSEGIMFSVRPPKKSWKKIYNLSGGEKTLSSLALVFALHHFKPTPLYFMDEIDAALDFKNVSIVACYIYEQTKNAQFIIISLRNNMFEMADRLIGIYKTHNTTKNVAINPKTIVLRQIETV
ncbi:structural maintenance of chromosomes protein 4-like [Sinocyclocheilus rhinocerous]|uniref:structural maintenance of chromosomes protein 4-like n=1 Tax=Sinocyclocheilus rhinocerous TaxID=307959 RepID=UPI0007BAAE83|nr:PREDICTED: structural maintenance of chromosomes protein 4-like [Sinocyclocheilus rhinocerous]